MDNSKFSKIALGLSVLALITSVVVMIITFTGNKSVTDEVTKPKVSLNDSSTIGGIAYVNTDSLLLEYKYSIKLNEEFLTEQAKAQANLEASYRALQKRYEAFQEKVRLNSFISQASAESQQNDLIQEESRIQQMQEDLTNELMEKQANITKELYDSVMNFIDVYYNGHFNLILGDGTGSSILYANPDMDITREVIDELNARYESNQTAQ